MDNPSRTGSEERDGNAASSVPHDTGDPPSAPTVTISGEATLTQPSASPPTGAPLPDRIGRYRILRLIGAGGMGAVYEAEQERPRRVVALKVIRPGVASPTMLRRFEQESQVLGRLQHPGIAQIFEAGTADAGAGPQPFFAMELVIGRTLTAYANSARLALRERLELMARICDAVHHAHQKGVIHRDLKPGNILVDETGQPKILDFGLARATDSDIQATMQTDVGHIVGTLPYMSPEQVSADPSELDTRSDVYALGVILYELLAGRLPYVVQNKTLPEAVRVIREEEPARLSSIERAFRGDVETIAAKALEKEKDSRYGSAAELAEDIRRYLRDEPIVARPPSTVYHLRKFAKRHKALVGGVAAVFVVLVAGVITSSWQAVRATRAEALATTRLEQAKKETAKAEAVNAFLQEMLGSVDPTKMKGQEVTVRDALDEAAKKVEGGSLADQPEVEAAVRTTLGTTYSALGLYAEADPHLRSALETRREALGPEHVEVASSLNELAILRRLQGDYAAAELLVREALAIQRRALGNWHQDVAASLGNLANLVRARGDLAGAEPLLRESVAIQRKVLGDEHPDVGTSLDSMAHLLLERGDLAGAESLARESLAIRRKALGSEHPNVAMGMNNLAGILQSRGDLAAAEPLFRDALALRRKILGDDHPMVAQGLNNVANVLAARGECPAAESLFRKALSIQRDKLPAHHPDIASTMSNLGRCLIEQGRHTEAEPLLRESLDIREEGPSSDWRLFNAKSLLGAALAGQGKFEEAEPLLLSGYDGMKDQAAAPLARREQALARIVAFYEAWNKPEKVAAWRATPPAAPAP